MEIERQRWGDQVIMMKATMTCGEKFNQGLFDTVNVNWSALVAKTNPNTSHAPWEFKNSFVLNNF